MSGNTPPTDLLQHVPPDATRADVLSLGCGDLRNILYSILLHGRYGGMGRGRTPRALSFTQNDWEPAIHARNIILIQMILDSRSLVEEACSAAPKNGNRKKRSQKKGANKKEPGQVSSDSNNAVADTPDWVAFAQRMGVIFSTMYNTFVDADVLAMIHDVARRLAASTASPDAWASTDLGRIIRFTDDRSRERVRDVLTRYTDDSLRGKGFAARVKGERASFIAKFIPENTTIFSRTLGLASSRWTECARAYSEMRSHYIKHGSLDPFPLLRATKGSSEPRGPGDLVNPLLLVTERKGLEYCLHYGSFPLDAFHTDVVWWKLQPEHLQDEYGKLAPRVTKHRELNSFIGKDSLTATAIPHRIMQEAWMGAALEELAQMCGAFLRLTSMTELTVERLTINVHVGDALNFCDALVAMPHSVVPLGESARHEDGCSRRFPSPATPPFFFQQGSLSPLYLCGGVFTGRPEFDVISTSNLAEHLGLVNLLVATAPLLRRSPHAVLLTSLMASLKSLPTYKDTSDFYEKIMCMTPQAASILLGVVPISSLSSVVGQADTLTRLTIERPELWPSSAGPTGGVASTLRLPWKHAALAFTEASVRERSILVEVSPDAFVDLTLPVYKAMMSHIPTVATLVSGPLNMSRNQDFLRALSTPNHYTPASFGRLLRLAGRRLRLGTEHFQAALHATINCSGLSLASNLAQEQVALFQALDLVPIRKSYGGRMRSIPLDTRRVVLLVPQSGINLLRAFITPEVFLSLTAKNGTFDNHFVSIHMAYVRVHRGSVNLNGNKKQSADGWRSLNGHLAVRDTREDDPEAELMVSAVVPTLGLLASPPALVEAKLSPRDGHEIFRAPKETKDRLGMGLWKRAVFFKADLADVDRTAILTPGQACQPGNNQFPRHLPIPAKALRGEFDTDSSGYDDEQGSGGEEGRHGSSHGHPAVHQSVELRTQKLDGGGLRTACTVTLRMVSGGARQGLHSGVPHLEKTLDLCSLRVTLGEGFSHMVCLPFPVKWNAVHVKFSRRQGFVALTVPPADSPFQLPVMRVTCGVGGNPPCCPLLLPSSLFWSPCAPLASLPRLDLKTEWAHKMVHGIMSIPLSERASLGEATSGKTGETNSAIFELKKSFLHISAIACENHSDDRPGWKHPWVCITEGSDRGKRAIWIWVNGILLDSSNEALILDCCVLPVDRMIDDVSARLGFAVAQDNGQSGPGVSLIEASTKEVDLWDSLLPAVVERARQTYAHAVDCSYNKRSEVRPRLCKCGRGEDLPRGFMLPIRTARAVGEGPPLHTLVYRAALSPLYAPTETACLPPVGETPGAGDGRNVIGHAQKCAMCGKGGRSMKCSGCHAVSYCSKECQRKDWKRHKPACA
ncbi:unnamed protein product [Scytosiphon promiscuus]